MSGLVRLFGALLVAAMVVTCNRGSTLQVYGDVPAFSMKDQDGRAFTNDTLHGKVWAAAFVFTRCPTACPRVTRAMRSVQANATSRGVALELVSFTIDPEFDTPEVLKKYATEYAADLKSWAFVTGGDSANVQSTAEHGFKIAAQGTADPSKPDFGISHGTQLVLVDKDGKIRGYYGTGDEAALGKLVEDAGALGG